MEVQFYQSGCSDAAHISFRDEQNKPYHIFIDAGFERTFRQVLNGEIQAIVSKGETISLWIISHIHDDHIGGAISYINAVKSKLLPDIVENWWYNAPRRSPLRANVHCGMTSSPSSIRQGDQLSQYLTLRGDWDNLPVISGDEPFEIGGLKIIVLSPDEENLRTLQEKYNQPGVPFEMNEGRQVSEAMGAKTRDYHFKIEELVLMGFKEDTNIENGSSIAMVTDYHGFKILWLSDAHPSVVLNALIKLGHSEANPLVCDWVKISHHGSAGNNSMELYHVIHCNNYIISVNGDNSHGLPNKAALVNILSSRKQVESQQYHFYFTHDDHILRTMFLVDDIDVFERFNFRVHFTGNEKWIHVKP